MKVTSVFHPYFATVMMTVQIACSAIQPFQNVNMLLAMQNHAKLLGIGVFKPIP